MKGGKRKGAGRPKLPPGVRKIPINVRLPRELVEWLREQPKSQSQLITEALNLKRGNQ